MTVYVGIVKICKVLCVFFFYKVVFASEGKDF